MKFSGIDFLFIDIDTLESSDSQPLELIFSTFPLFFDGIKGIVFFGTFLQRFFLLHSTFLQKASERYSLFFDIQKMIPFSDCSLFFHSSCPVNITMHLQYTEESLKYIDIISSSQKKVFVVFEFFSDEQLFLFIDFLKTRGFLELVSGELTQKTYKKDNISFSLFPFSKKKIRDLSGIEINNFTIIVDKTYLSQGCYLSLNGDIHDYLNLDETPQYITNIFFDMPVIDFDIYTYINNYYSLGE